MDPCLRSGKRRQVQPGFGIPGFYLNCTTYQGPGLVSLAMHGGVAGSHIEVVGLDIIRAGPPQVIPAACIQSNTECTGHGLRNIFLHVVNRQHNKNN